MKSSPLQRRTPLRSKVGLKRTPFKPSARAIQRKREESNRRQEVYAYLYEHCPVNAESVRICKMCGRLLDWHWMGHEMHHVIPLSRGGKTTQENCELWCYPCHQRRHSGGKCKESN